MNAVNHPISGRQQIGQTWNRNFFESDISTKEQNTFWRRSFVSFLLKKISTIHDWKKRKRLCGEKRQTRWRKIERILVIRFMSVCLMERKKENVCDYVYV